MSIIIDIKTGQHEDWHEVQCAGYEILIKDYLSGKSQAGLTFEKENHTYTFNGVVIPSVTQILKSAGFFNYGKVNADVLSQAAQRGTAVHYACALDDKDNLGGCPIDILPYLHSWRQFKEDYKNQLEFKIIESALVSPMYRFGGTPDRFAINGKTKSTYDHWIVHLSTKGYKVEPVKNEDKELNRKTFLAALQIQNWKQSKKGNKYDTAND